MYRPFSWKNFTIFALITILVRLFLTMNMPIFAVTHSGVDDYWMVMHANAILAGKWMGGYYNATLIKGMSFPAFLAILHGLGISYYTGVNLFYLVCLVILTVALRPFLDRMNGRYAWVVYVIFVVLAFHPILYTASAMTRVYRNSVTPSQVILVIACLYAFYLRRNEPFKKWIFWIVLESLAMIFFIHTREDSMWIYVLYAVISLIILGSLFMQILKDRSEPKRKKKEKGQTVSPVRRLLLMAVTLVLPLIAVFCMTTVIRTINQKVYGLPIVNELTEGSFAKALQSLYEIRMEEAETDLVTVPRVKLEKACEVSPTLNLIKPELDKYYNNPKAHVDETAPDEYVDGLFFWQLRFAAEEAGFHKSLPQADAFYAQIAEEIQAAFDAGKLERRQGLMFSSLMPPIKKNTFRNSFACFFDALKYAVTSDFWAKAEWSDPEMKELADFQQLTYDRVINATDVITGTPSARSRLAGYNATIERVNIVSYLYNLLKWPVLVLSVVSYLAVCILALVHHFRKDAYRGGRVYQLFLFATGFLGAFLMQVFIVGYNAAVNVGPLNISHFYLTGCYPCWYLFALLSIAGAVTGLSEVFRKTS